MESKRLANFIEKLRYGRKISQEEFVHNITSLRQYQRYRAGECELPLDIISKMSHKLRIPLKKLYGEFEKEKINETRIVTKYYNYVVSRDFINAHMIKETIDFDLFIDDEKKKFFSSATFLLNYFENKLSLVKMIRKQAELVNYPLILRNSILTDCETLILGTIMEYSKNDREEIITKLEKIVLDEELQISGANIFASTQVIFWLSKNYGRQKDYLKVIELCNLGIEKNKEIFTYYMLEYFYYYRALAYLRTDCHHEFEKDLFNTLTILELLSPKERQRFYRIIEKDTNINAYDFFIDKLNVKKNTDS